MIESNLSGMESSDLDVDMLATIPPQQQQPQSSQDSKLAVLMSHQPHELSTIHVSILSTSVIFI